MCDEDLLVAALVINHLGRFSRLAKRDFTINELRSGDDILRLRGQDAGNLDTCDLLIRSGVWGCVEKALASVPASFSLALQLLKELQPKAFRVVAGFVHYSNPNNRGL